tara:strand:+ start:792 stop:998 length:207 start_codon:yes stop_codon:yes gene_type:complete
VNLASSLEEIVTSYAPGIILMFSTLKLKLNSLSVSPTTTANSFDVSFFLSLTTNLTTPASPTAARSGN